MNLMDTRWASHIAQTFRWIMSKVCLGIDWELWLGKTTEETADSHLRPGLHKDVITSNSRLEQKRPCFSRLSFVICDLWFLQLSQMIYAPTCMYEHVHCVGVPHSACVCMLCHVRMCTVHTFPAFQWDAKFGIPLECGEHPVVSGLTHICQISFRCFWNSLGVFLLPSMSAVLDAQQRNRLAKEVYGTSLTPVSVQQTTSYWLWHVARLCW